MSIFDRLFNRNASKSGNVAKNRLQLVLVHDRSDLSPGRMDQLKDDLIAVISKYVEIDQAGIDITLTKEENQSRLTAQIPLVSARQR